MMLVKLSKDIGPSATVLLFDFLRFLASNPYSGPRRVASGKCHGMPTRRHQANGVRLRLAQSLLSETQRFQRVAALHRDTESHHVLDS